jgi:hypothetical protein
MRVSHHVSLLNREYVFTARRVPRVYHTHEDDPKTFSEAHLG